MNTHSQIQIITAPGIADPTADEVAAAIAAIVSVTSIHYSDAQVDTSEEDTSWHSTAKLVSQGIVPGRTPAKPNWGRIERIRRAGKGGSGITGL